MGSVTTQTAEDVALAHRDRVYRIALRLTADPHDAEDLTQEVFLRVFRAWDGYTPGPPGSLEAWLYRITSNVFLDSVRRRRRVRVEPLLDDLRGRLRSREAGPEDVAAGRLGADVLAALRDLRPEYRVCVVLHDCEGMTYEEIAAILDVPLGTVRSRLHRGRAALRAALPHRRPSRPGATPTPPAVPARWPRLGLHPA
jgi:RNA polymerase sigma-70 factor (ECF subfamily)